MPYQLLCRVPSHYISTRQNSLTQYAFFYRVAQASQDFHSSSSLYSQIGLKYPQLPPSLFKTWFHPDGIQKENDQIHTELLVTHLWFPEMLVYLSKNRMLQLKEWIDKPLPKGQTQLAPVYV